jgi:succinoglycan biosynthesis protein ExoA
MISIIIPCRNERHSIGRMLDSLESQDLRVQWEALVADGMSDDGTREVLRQHCEKNSRIRMIDNPGRIVSTGLNAAIREARGEIIIRMDAHTEYSPDYVHQCIDALESSGAENVGGPPRARAAGIVQRAIAAAYHSPFSNGGALCHDESYEGFADTVFYGCWRKSTLERIGMFDEAMVRNQDDELNLRLVRAGGKIWQTPKIVSWYQPRRSLATLFRQYAQYGFWKVEVIRKHRIPASWRHLVPAAFVLGNGLLLGAAAVAAFAGGKQAATDLLNIWLAGAALYAAGCLAASVQAARKRGWTLLPLLPLVFAIYHVSYGAGFLANAGYYSLTRSGPLQPGRAFTSVTR